MEFQDGIGNDLGHLFLKEVSGAVLADEDRAPQSSASASSARASAWALTQWADGFRGLSENPLGASAKGHD